MSAKTIPVLLDKCWRNLAEKDDRMSPEEYADMALITKKELGDYLARAALSTPTEGPASQTEGMGGAFSEWELGVLRQSASAKHLVYLGHHAAGGLKADEIKTMERWQALCDKLAALTPSETAEAVPVASDPAPATDERERLVEAHVWRTMDSAPLDGKHCILALESGCYILSAQGFYHRGKWITVLEGWSGEPLAWMPNVLLPDELCPERFRRGRAALATETSR